MKKINQSVIVAALGLTFSMVVQAETCEVPATRAQVIEQRTIVRRSMIVQQPAGIPAVVVSGATLSGRREVISNNAVVFPSDGARGRVVMTDGAGRTVSRPVRGYVSPGALTPAQQSIAFGGTPMGY